MNVILIYVLICMYVMYAIHVKYACRYVCYVCMHVCAYVCYVCMRCYVVPSYMPLCCGMYAWHVCMDVLHMYHVCTHVMLSDNMICYAGMFYGMRFMHIMYIMYVRTYVCMLCRSAMLCYGVYVC